MGKQSHVAAGGLAATLGIGAFADDCVRLGIRGGGSMVDDVARVGVVGSVDDAARLGLRNGALGRAAPGLSDDAARLAPAYRGRMVWGPRVGASADEAAVGRLPSRGPMPGRWVDEAVEQGAELVIDIATIDDGQLDLTVVRDEVPLRTPPPFVQPALLTERQWRTPDTHLTLVHVDDPSLDSRDIQRTCLEQGLRCLIVRCPPASLVCHEAARFAWNDVNDQAHALPGDETESWYLSRFAHEISFSADVGVQLEALVLDGAIPKMVRTRPATP